MKKPLTVLIIVCVFSFLFGLLGQSSVTTGIVHVHKTRTIARTCTVSNQLYLVTYEYDPLGGCFVPATNPPGQPHYKCKTTVFKAVQVGQPFDGDVTEDGCFEDVPEDMVKNALKP